MGVWSQRSRVKQNSRDYRAERAGWEETIRFCEDSSFFVSGAFLGGALSGFVGDCVCPGEEVTKVVWNKHETLHVSGGSIMRRTLLNLSLGLACWSVTFSLPSAIHRRRPSLLCGLLWRVR